MRLAISPDCTADPPGEFTASATAAGRAPKADSSAGPMNSSLSEDAMRPGIPIGP